jgi:hypothetical protein
VLAWRCGDATVAVNLGDAPSEVTASGTIAVGTDRGRDGERVHHAVTLAAYEGAIIL